MLNFQKLDVYQRSIEFLVVSLELVAELPKGHADLASQLRASAQSTVAVAVAVNDADHVNVHPHLYVGDAHLDRARVLRPAVAQLDVRDVRVGTDGRRDARWRTRQPVSRRARRRG